MIQRTFQLDNQWNIIHYPEQPSGFSVMILGDHSHYVESGNSYWLQHPGRFQLLEQLKSAGYTIFSSNAIGNGWGSPQSIKHSKSVYQIMMKSEILNSKIHLMAEGTGSMTALALMNEMAESIRSVVLINPCLSLVKMLEKEAGNKVFYKKWLKDISMAYGVSSDELEGVLSNHAEPFWIGDIPLKIIHVFGNVGQDQSFLYNELAKNRENIEIQYLFPEKRYKVGMQAVRFFEKHEDDL